MEKVDVYQFPDNDSIVKNDQSSTNSMKKIGLRHTKKVSTCNHTHNRTLLMQYNCRPQNQMPPTLNNEQEPPSEDVVAGLPGDVPACEAIGQCKRTRKTPKRHLDYVLSAISPIATKNIRKLRRKLRRSACMNSIRFKVDREDHF